MWNAVVYNTHDQMDESVVLVNAANNSNKLFVRAKSSVQDLDLRVDLEDVTGYVTNLNAQNNTVAGEDFNIYEFDFSGAYQDGGFGGPYTSDIAPCTVDAERITAVQFFLWPGVGLFDGTLEIDWISFGEPLDVDIIDYENVKTAKIYPNPNDGAFYVTADLNQEIDQVEISIYDLSGRLVSTKSYTNNGAGLNAEINISDYKSGAYFLQASSKGQLLFNKKLMLK